MNLKLIESASNAYADIPQDDVNRLAFFRSIWNVQAQAIEDCNAEYEVPSEHDLKICIAKPMPVFKNNPVSVDAGRLAKDAADIAECMTGKKMLNDAAQKLLEGMDWAKILGGMDMKLAGGEPESFTVLFAQALVEAGNEPAAAAVAMNVLSMALRCQLEKPAAAVNKELRRLKEFEDPKPLVCPCCGSEPTLAHVGGKTSSQGRGRVLVCSQCGTDWEFDRIRCARCGEHNPSKLHYFNIEGDDAHRIATCDGCGGYMRTLFSEEGDLKPVSYEVEDVIMARLDALAADERFHAKGEQE